MWSQADAKESDEEVTVVINITEYNGKQGIQYRASVGVDKASRKREMTMKSGFATRQNAEKWAQEYLQQ